MVFGKHTETAHTTEHGVVPNVAQQQTTVTTTTQAVPTKTAPLNQAPGAIVKDAIVTNVMEKPILQNVIEKKNVEVHHKQVVQEVHQQKIIEIEKQPVVQQVQQAPLLQQSRAETVFQEVGNRELGEQERLRLESLRLQGAPKVQNQQTVQQFREGETVSQVIRQENIERHVQPVITEVREQQVVQEVLHPVVRKVHEPTIVREVHSTGIVQQQGLTQQATLQQQGIHNSQWRREQNYSSDTGRFQTFARSQFPQTQGSTGSNLLKAVSCSGKNFIYGLTNAGELYHLSGRVGEQQWTPMDVGGFRLKDISVARGGTIFGIGMDGSLWKYHAGKFEALLPNDVNRLQSISAMSKRKIYGIDESGQPLFLKLARFGSNNTWERLGAIKLRKISTGGRLLRRTEVWGLDQQGSAFRWFNDSWVPMNMKLRDISVALDNAVYGVSQDGRLMKWDGGDSFHLQDRELKGDNRDYIMNARLSNVTAYKEGKHVYGIEEGSSNMLRMLF
jgi:hypothetical protein